MLIPIYKKFKVITEYHNGESSETICETFEELTGTLGRAYSTVSKFIKSVTIEEVN